MAMNDILIHAHGSVMTVAWIVFGSTGILLARYGRVLRFGNQRQLLGKSVWFQTHRFCLSLTSLLTLMGIFFVIIHTNGQWVNMTIDGTGTFIHSILGSIILCCIIIQIWLALYRCHPNSHFRFIFNWSHRMIGSFSSLAPFMNIFLITYVLTQQTIVYIILISIWFGWIIIIIIILEIIQYQYRQATLLIAINHTNEQILVNRNIQTDIEASTNPILDNQRLNKIKFILFLFHILISLVVFISFFSQQN